MKIGIIGTAGRHEDGKRLDAKSYTRMQDTLHEIITDAGGLGNTDFVVSGGAAWADHLAVWMACEHNARLSLHFPCVFVPGSGTINRPGYRDNGLRGIKNPGRTANYYHYMFGKKVFGDLDGSLNQIQEALKKTTTISTVSGGFFARNRLVAGESTLLIVFTFGDGPRVKDGGSANTSEIFVKKHGFDNAIHVDLNTWKIHRPIQLTPK
jgi:hypothetical protein